MLTSKVSPSQLIEEARLTTPASHSGYVESITDQSVIIARGKAALRSACQISCGSRLGCGLLVLPDRVLTHWSVFDGTCKASHMVAKRAAADSCITVYYKEEQGAASKCQVPLRPDLFFLGDSCLGFCIVGVDAAPKGVELAHVPLSRRSAIVEQGTHLSIVHKVRPEVQIDETHVLAMMGDFIRYTGAPSVNAANGSPVFDDIWNIVGVHHNEESSNHWKKGLRIKSVLEELEKQSCCVDHLVIQCKQCWFHCKYCQCFRYQPAAAHMEEHMDEVLKKMSQMNTQMDQLRTENIQLRELIRVQVHIVVEKASCPGKKQTVNPTLVCLIVHTSVFQLIWDTRYGSTIADVKKYVDSQCNANGNHQTVFIEGAKPLDDSITLRQLNLQDKGVLYVMMTGPAEILSTVYVQIVGCETKIEWKIPLATTTVRDLKCYLQDQKLCGDRQRAFFSGRILDDR